MKKYFGLIGVTLFWVTLVVPAMPLWAGDDKDKKEPLSWLTFEQGLAKSQKDKKLMVVDFYTTWCGWCKVMDKETYGSDNIIKFAKAKLVLVKVNAESNEKTRFRDKDYTYRELAMAFGVSGYPATAFIDTNGEVLTLVQGYIPAEKFLPILEYLEGGHHKTMKFEEFLEKRKKS